LRTSPGMSARKPIIASTTIFLVLQQLGL